MEVVKENIKEMQKVIDKYEELLSKENKVLESNRLEHKEKSDNYINQQDNIDVMDLILLELEDLITDSEKNIEGLKKKIERRKNFLEEYKKRTKNQ